MKKTIGIILLTGLIAYVVIFVPPENIYIKIAFIFLLSSYFYYITSFLISSKKDLILIFIFVTGFLLSNLFAGFNLINILLLTSFIIGLRLLLK